MAAERNDILDGILKSLDGINYIRPGEIPDIDLYMDQVTTFMDNHLRSSIRDDGDKILTKTMINNYAKNHLIPSPVKKKYSKDHMLLLIFIYYFKSILSIDDIQRLFGPITEKYFGSDAAASNGLSLEDIYSEVFGMEKGQTEAMKQDVIQKYELSRTTFDDAPDGDAEFLKLFSFICTLSYDVYVKKLLIENLIDQISEKEPDK